mgnify:FL=1
MRVELPPQRREFVFVLRRPRNNFFFPLCHAAFLSFPRSMRIPMPVTTTSAAGIAIQTPVIPKSAEKSNKNGSTKTIPRSSDKTCACLSRAVDTKYIMVNKLNPRKTQLVK